MVVMCNDANVFFAGGLRLRRTKIEKEVRMWEYGNKWADHRLEEIQM